MIGPKAYIHLDRLKQNIWNIRRNIGNRNLMIVVKANGYGHGSLNIAKHLSDEPGITFCVFTIQEGIELRREGINNPILIFSRIHKDWIALAIKYKLWVNTDIRIFLEKNYKKEVLEAYECLKPYAYKSDLARYCLIYKLGGGYVDLATRFENKSTIHQTSF